MTPEEKFMFDLEGYLIVKNVLSQDEIDRLNEIADRVLPKEYNDKGFRGGSRVSQWDPFCQNLFDHPNIVPYLIELLGPKFRADHDYAIFMKKGAQRGHLHGGDIEYATQRAGDHWYKYRDGVMRNGLTVFTYNLAPAKKGAGGFTCIPGSHKSNLPLNVPDEVRSFERPAHYVARPEVEAGDVVIFTEALIHGTSRWNADHERRSLLFKFSPGHSSWSQNYYNLDEFEGLTEQQKRILAPPSVGNRPDSVQLETA
ncbi:MAG: phytanoyl-CoA dioxygenase family protein [bacterium]|nr:phytanoyl-CoA dioxygenase family protein [bacterium]